MSLELQRGARKLLKAPFLVLIGQPVLREGYLLLEGEKIIGVGGQHELPALSSFSPVEVFDFPQTLILPGFVNAHSHLTLSPFEQMGYPGTFTGWVQKIVAQKIDFNSEQVKTTIRRGIREMVASGITTVGDHVGTDAPIEEVLSSPLTGRIFLEVIGASRAMAQSTLEKAREISSQWAKHPRFLVHPSPHSFHAVHPEILRALFSGQDPFFSMHLAESSEEELFFREQSGALYEFVRQRNGMTDFFREGKSSAIEWVAAIQNPRNRSSLLAIHCNYPTEKDLSYLSENRIPVVHCPSSHAYFGHERFPLEQFLQRQIPLALGTDSLASGQTLSMLDQIRIAQRTYPRVALEDWFEIATLGGARALGFENEVGSIQAGKRANLIGFQFQELRGETLFERILEAGKADWTMINGEFV